MEHNLSKLKANWLLAKDSSTPIKETTINGLLPLLTNPGQTPEKLLVLLAEELRTPVTHRCKKSQQPPKKTEISYQLSEPT